MNRRDFLGAAAALPAIAVVPAVAERPGLVAPSKVIKVSWHGRVLKETGDIPMRAQNAAYAEWRREVREMGERHGLEIVEERSHYFPAGEPSATDPLGQWACFAAEFTLGRLSG